MTDNTFVGSPENIFSRISSILVVSLLHYVAFDPQKYTQSILISTSCKENSGTNIYQIFSMSFTANIESRISYVTLFLYSSNLF